MKYTIEIELFDQSEDFLVNCEVHQFAIQLAKKTHSVITAGFVMSSEEKQQTDKEQDIVITPFVQPATVSKDAVRWTEIKTTN